MEQPGDTTSAAVGSAQRFVPSWIDFEEERLVQGDGISKQQSAAEDGEGTSAQESQLLLEENKLLKAENSSQADEIRQLKEHLAELTPKEEAQVGSVVLRE